VALVGASTTGRPFGGSPRRAPSFWVANKRHIGLGVGAAGFAP
jgi:hypothetical protein